MEGVAEHLVRSEAITIEVHKVWPLERSVMLNKRQQGSPLPCQIPSSLPSFLPSYIPQVIQLILLEDTTSADKSNLM